MPPYMASVDLGKGNESILWDGESIGYLNKRMLIRIMADKVNLQFKMFSEIHEREPGIPHTQKFWFC
jgi:hypothetical protein